jgi:ubiquinone/menaquinone biosynthesis C-methylase UbiE
MPKREGNKWFAAFWDWQTRHEPAAIRGWRAEIAGGAKGQVLEIGCGVGANFPHYSDCATSIVATDPDPFMLGKARGAAAAARRPIEVQKASAHDLPFEPNSFDTVVSTANMCSIPNPSKALSEVVRVLTPVGEYRFFDHVRYQNAVGGFFQDIATPLWKWCGGGCHPNRNVAQLIRESGLEFTSIKRLAVVPPVPPFIIVRPCIKGVAVRPQTSEA